ncbi:MAG: glycosyltransferase family 9 protein [Winogradskyella sp.]|nr:glycosyltransferase family 9 protein [Winogradskyella sp.]
MGDVAMTVPVIKALINQYPDLKITVVTRAFFKPLFSGLKNVGVYTADLKGEHKGILGLYKLSKELKALNFDVVADLHNVLRSKILKVFFTGKKVIQIDKGRHEKKALTSGKEFKQLKTTHQRYADVFENLGFPLVLSQPSFPSKVDLSQDLKTFITDASKKTIGIAPFAAHQGKMYPLAQMKDVIKQLSKEYNIILFGGGKEETAILNKIEKEHQSVVSAAGKLSFEDELSLISNLDVMLSMDSGNGHLAAMYGVKVITIWGVTHPFAGFVQYNQPEEHQLTANRDKFPLIPTSIYGNKYPEGYDNAAGSISADEVVEKVKSIIPAQS